MAGMLISLHEKTFAIMERILHAGKIEKADYLLLPINNQLKDPLQIETDLQQEIIHKQKEFCLQLDGRLMPVSEILKMAMEENY